MGSQAANAIMAISFFGAIAISVVAIAAVWYKRLDAGLHAENMAAQLPPGRAPEARVITPH